MAKGESIVTAKAGKKKAGRKASHMHIERAKNGFMSTTHYEKPEGERMTGYEEPEKNVHENTASLKSHIGKVFGGDSDGDNDQD